MPYLQYHQHFQLFYFAEFLRTILVQHQHTDLSVFLTHNNVPILTFTTEIR